MDNMGNTCNIFVAGFFPKPFLSHPPTRIPLFSSYFALFPKHNNKEKINIFKKLHYDY